MLKLQLKQVNQADIKLNAQNCRNCGAGLEADRIDQTLRIVSCGHCGSMHDLPSSSVERSANDANTSQPKLERQEVALPEQFKVHRSGAGIEITWPVGGMFQGIVLLVIAAAFSYVAVTEGMYFLIAASVALVYFAAVRAFNHHQIRTNSTDLRVTQGPLPWFGTRKFKSADIQQLFSVEYEIRTEQGSDNERRTVVRKNYKLLANTSAKNRATLLKGLADPLQALWLEQEIERALGIRDKRVAGEHWD